MQYKKTVIDLCTKLLQRDSLLIVYATCRLIVTAKGPAFRLSSGSVVDISSFMNVIHPEGLRFEARHFRGKGLFLAGERGLFPMAFSLISFDSHAFAATP